MEVLRTPAERFQDLPGWPWAARARDDLPGFEGLRLAYVDEGPREAEVFLCLHGQPTWSYLYRRMIPPFLEAGMRAVAPDFFGFGRSDKPADEVFYTFDTHRRALIALVEALDLRRVTLVVQDWGGILGLTLPMDMPGRFARLLVMNTALGTGERPLGPGFLAWREWCNRNPDMAVGRLMRRACPHLTDAEAAAYDAPFPDAAFKAGVRRFPNLVPDRPYAPGADISRRARDFLKNQWSGETFMGVGATDPVIPPSAMQALRRVIRNCPEPLILAEAGHFVPEWGEPVAKAALAAFGLARDGSARAWQ